MAVKAEKTKIEGEPVCECMTDNREWQIMPGTLQAIPDVAKAISPARKAVVALIQKLCDDVTNGRARDEYKSYDAIAELMNSIK